MVKRKGLSIWSKHDTGWNMVTPPSILKLSYVGMSSDIQDARGIHAIINGVILELKIAVYLKFISNE